MESEAVSPAETLTRTPNDRYTLIWYEVLFGGVLQRDTSETNSSLFGPRHSTRLGRSLKASDAGQIARSILGPAGLYIHVPFCKSICPFCPYNKVLYQENLVSDYFPALRLELQCYLDRLPRGFSSLYIGGGTPTLFLDELGELIGTLPIDGERAIEVLPTHATTVNVEKMRAIGITYLSLGVQSFNEKVLRYLERPTTAQDNRNALENVIGRFDCVDVDLIFDVAFEAESIFLNDLETCFKAGVDQVSTYPLMRFGYTPFGKSKHQPKKEHDCLKKATDLARQLGYERRSVWTFNRRNAPNYSSITREFYLGCGAGAASYTGRSFLLNHFSIPAYLAKVRDQRLPIARMLAMSSKRAASYYLFWQAYTGMLDLSRFNTFFPGQLMVMGAIDLLRRAGLMRKAEDRLVLTDRGYDRYHDMERWVTYHFIEPLWAEMMQEHAALAGRLPKTRAGDRVWLRLAGLK